MVMLKTGGPAGRFGVALKMGAVLSAAALMPCVGARAEDAQSAQIATRSGDSQVITADTFVKIADKCLPSVVAVYVKSSVREQMQAMRDQADPEHEKLFNDPRLRKFLDPESEGSEGEPGADGKDADPKAASPLNEEVRTSGSGVILTREGHIVTNLHIIANAKEGSISVVLNDDTEIPPEKVKVLAKDSMVDIAVLQIDTTGLDLKPIEWGDSDDVRIGDWVIAIGNPLDLRGSVSTGIVSAKARKIEKVAIEHLIQTDAMINPGNSGGAMVNLKGQLVGINMAIATNSGFFQGIGFAVPARDARFVTDQVIKDGKIRRGYIGIEMSPVSPDLGKALGLGDGFKGGVLVQNVLSGAPADQAGVKIYDVITQVDDSKLKEPSDLLASVASKPVGDTAQIKILRQDKSGVEEKALTLHVIERPSDDQITRQREEMLTIRPSHGEKPAPPKDPLARLGLKVKPFEHDQVKGLEVVEVAPRSNAATAGVRPGDILLELNRRSVTSEKSAEDAIGAAPKDAAHLARVLQNGQYMIVTIKPAADAKE